MGDEARSKPEEEDGEEKKQKKTRARGRGSRCETWKMKVKSQGQERTTRIGENNKTHSSGLPTGPRIRMPAVLQESDPGINSWLYCTYATVPTKIPAAAPTAVPTDRYLTY